MSKPRVVLDGPHWRVVAVELPDQHGVAQLEYIIEMTEPKDRDALGVQRWTQLTSKSAMVDWVRIARRFLDELLKAAGEKPDADHRHG
jgi:predicted metal-dependent peptidase